MWTIIKIDRKRISFLKKDFSKKLGENFKIYSPKIITEKYAQNKLVKKETSVLGDYLFCYHKEFSKLETINKLKFSRGLKYFLKGFLEAQKEIDEFIKKCKSLEDSKGYLSENIFNLEVDRNYRFISGPFVQKIFKIISFQKKTIEIEMGNLKTNINKKRFLFNPI